jgi:hypothetical protein
VTVTQAGRYQRQRAAASVPRVILDAHWPLPFISWLIGPRGVLVGKVSEPADAEHRAVSGQWRDALGLTGEECSDGTGTAYLHAAAYRSPVQVRITASVRDDGPGQDSW